MIWDCITFNGVGTSTTVNGNINAAKYIEIPENNLWPVIVRHYPEENYIFQDDNAPVHRARKCAKLQNTEQYKWYVLVGKISGCEHYWKLLAPVEEFSAETALPCSQCYRHGERNHGHLANHSITLHYIRNLYRSLPTRMLKIRATYPSIEVSHLFFLDVMKLRSAC